MSALLRSACVARERRLEQPARGGVRRLSLTSGRGARPGMCRRAACGPGAHRREERSGVSSSLPTSRVVRGDVQLRHGPALLSAPHSSRSLYQYSHTTPTTDAAGTAYRLRPRALPISAAAFTCQQHESSRGDRAEKQLRWHRCAHSLSVLHLSPSALPIAACSLLGRPE